MRTCSKIVRKALFLVDAPGMIPYLSRAKKRPHRRSRHGPSLGRKRHQAYVIANDHSQENRPDKREWQGFIASAALFFGKKHVTVHFLGNCHFKRRVFGTKLCTATHTLHCNSRLHASQLFPALRRDAEKKRLGYLKGSESVPQASPLDPGARPGRRQGRWSDARAAPALTSSP